MDFTMVRTRQHHPGSTDVLSASWNVDYSYSFVSYMEGLKLKCREIR